MNCIGWISPQDIIHPKDINFDEKLDKWIYKKEISISTDDNEKSYITYSFQELKFPLLTNIKIYDAANSVDEIITLTLKKYDKNGCFCFFIDKIRDDFKASENITILINTIFRDFELSFSTIIRPTKIKPLILDNELIGSPFPNQTIIKSIFSIYQQELDVLFKFISAADSFEISNSPLNEQYLKLTMNKRRDFICTGNSAFVFLDLYRGFFSQEDYIRFNSVLKNKIQYVNSICESLDFAYNVDLAENIKSILLHTHQLELFIVLLGIVTILADLLKEISIGLSFLILIEYILIVIYLRKDNTKSFL
ncbi:hypothetical protein [uncultured Methanospirillum sp.]|uniref:hypothetical protein n=1 Tax=uncultured Methanospirillum sp. TaxID=262503 RepID=UPI0029C96E38|nr:hypothetical protein [uncultured Methanospirillum sp.]